MKRSEKKSCEVKQAVIRARPTELSKWCKYMQEIYAETSRPHYVAVAVLIYVST